MADIRYTDAVVVLGAGLAGAAAALELAQGGQEVVLVDRTPRPMMAASRHNEGKLHLGYIYAADPARRTHALLSEGSLAFADTIERLTGAPKELLVVSDAFSYIVPDDSTHSPDELWEHFQAVDDTVAWQANALGIAALQPSRKADAGYLKAHFSSRVRAGFITPEVAVDPGRVADIMTAAVYTERNIAFRGSCTVQQVERRGDGRYGVTLEAGGGVETLIAPAVINALWEDRVRFDAMVGLDSGFTWAQRWKATVMIDVPPGEVRIPSTTALVGPYGDFVLYGDRRVYVSWYPDCRLSMSTDRPADEARAAVSEFDADVLRRASLDGLAKLIPEVAGLERFADSTRIGGGFIMAVGDSDIDDRESLLHERHQIGVEQRDAWVSVSSGKFCTAAGFGIEAARRMQAVMA